MKRRQSDPWMEAMLTDCYDSSASALHLSSIASTAR